MGAALGSFLADEWLGKDVSLLRDRPSPSPSLCLSYGPIRNEVQLSDGLITSALDVIMDFFVADQSRKMDGNRISYHGNRISSAEPQSEKRFVSQVFPHAPLLKEINSRQILE
ncbi:hypothetical protein CDAR_163791 [Caerostris darwini]|uniref:Uncharacterized protein n=1 Tax=Caerostris darwini TaxID=1538125 RepID=A0AAV4RTP8_9ARAC|nr:hypothetical protein CDAR_163791 [Caerostris darwini]